MERNIDSQVSHAGTRPLSTPKLPIPSTRVLHPLVEELMNKRFPEKKSREEFLSHKLTDLPDLTAMQDMEKAAARIINALDNNEIIGVYGDYDVDGTTSCALLAHFFEMLPGIPQVELFQPSRFIEGYGVHPSSLQDAHKKSVKVLITVDCGITSMAAAEEALSLGIDLIITDHHTDALPEMPRAYALVNPNRRDEPEGSPLRRLAGVGVAFALALKIKQMLEAKGQVVPTLYPLLQFVAIGTIGDLANLNPMNLKLTRHGLKQIPRSQYPGLLTFLSEEERQLACIPSEKVAFQIGPLINSKGRLDHPDEALRLLMAKTFEEAWPMYHHLTQCNNERKFVQKEVFDEAKKIVLQNIKEDGPHTPRPINIVYRPHWHEGVLGIVASKLVETFKVPSIVFSKVEVGDEGVEYVKGSARSAGELDLFQALDELRPLFLKLGGHKAAAGMTLKKENLSELQKGLHKSLFTIPEILRTVQKDFDLIVAPEQIDPQCVRDLDHLEPFGMGNPRPKFLVQGMVLDSYDILKELHIKWTFKSRQGGPQKWNGISFHYTNKWNALPPQEILERQSKEKLSVLCSLNINRFKGKEYLQLLIEELSFDYFY